MSEDKRDNTLFNKVRVALYQQASQLAWGYFSEINTTFDLSEHPKDTNYPYITVGIGAGVVRVLCTVSFKQDLKSIYTSNVHLHLRGEKTITVPEVAKISDALAKFESVAKKLREEAVK